MASYNFRLAGTVAEADRQCGSLFLHSHNSVGQLAAMHPFHHPADLAVTSNLWELQTLRAIPPYLIVDPREHAVRVDFV